MNTNSKLVGLLAIGLTFSSASLASISNLDPAIEGFLIGVGSISPQKAQYTLIQKEAFESRCNKELSVEELASESFQNIVFAIEVSETMESTGREERGVNAAALEAAKLYIDCTNFDRTFTQMIQDKEINDRYKNYTKLLKLWNQSYLDSKNAG